MRKLITLVSLTALLITGCTQAPSPEEATPVPAESTTETEPEPIEVEEVEVKEEPKAAPPPPPPPPVASSGDWNSDIEYMLDLVDSLESVGDLLDLLADFIELYPLVSENDVADMTDVAIETLATHRDYFRGTTPPDEFEEQHYYVLQAWEELDQALNLFGTGMRNGDFVMMEQGINMMDAAIRSMDRADAAMPLP